MTGLVGVIAYGLGTLIAFLFIATLLVVFIRDVTQKKHSVLRNYPVIGHLRYWMEQLGEYFRQYLFSNDREEMPFNRATRGWVYRLAKDEGGVIGFGSTNNSNEPGSILFVNAPYPVLEEDRLLFTGDHVMQGSTVVINPPDGSMGDYIDSLRMLRGTGIDYFAPGHGFLIGAPDDMIDLLVRHRLVREIKSLNAVKASDGASLEALTPVVYDDVPPFKHPWAARSLLAHLLKLRTDGAVAETGGVWRAV